MPPVMLTTTKVCPKCGSHALDWANPDSIKTEVTSIAIGTVCPACQWTIVIQCTMPTYTAFVAQDDALEEDVVVIPRRHLKVLYSNTELHTRKCNERTARESQAIEWCQAFFQAKEPSPEDDLHG